MTRAVRMVSLAALLLAPVLLGATGLDLSAEVDRSTVAMGERLLLLFVGTSPGPGCAAPVDELG